MKKIICVFLIVVKGLVTGLMFKCPPQSEWRHRANTVCSSEDKYVCLFNLLDKKHNEDCSGSELSNIGSKLVFQPLFNHAECITSRYQPFIFTTFGNSDCTLLKSTCNEEGQVIYSNGSSIDDVACRCDYTKRYAFVNQPRNPCFCKPAEEDCSCYRVICHKLSSDYECIIDKDVTAKTICQELHSPISYYRNVSTVGYMENTLNEFYGNPYAKIIITVIIVMYCVLLAGISFFVLQRKVTTEVIRSENDVILDPKWLVGAFHSVVFENIEPDITLSNDWQTLRNTGELTNSLLTRLFEREHQLHALENATHLIKVMKKYDVIMTLRDSDALYIPCLMKSFSFLHVYEQFFNETTSFKRTSWLCLEFTFLPPALYNHILAWYTKQYAVSHIPKHNVPTRRYALYRQIGVFDLDGSQTKKLVVCEGPSVIAIQVWDWNFTNSTYGNLGKTLFRFVDKLSQRYKLQNVQLSFKKTFKCEHGDFAKNMKTLKTLLGTEYFCSEHRAYHCSDDLVQPWEFIVELQKLRSPEESRRQEKEKAIERVQRALQKQLDMDQEEY